MHQGEAVVAIADGRIVGTKCRCRDLDATFVQRDGIGGAALVLPQPGEVKEGNGDRWMRGAEQFLVNGNRALQERLRLGKTALPSVHVAKIVCCRGDESMLGPVHLLQSGERTLQQL